LRLYLIRHTTLNIHPGICYGQSDVDVSDNFSNELHALDAKLTSTQFDAVYSSPLLRCAKLAHALEIGNAQIDARLQELDFGDWELQPWESIPREVFDVWVKDYANLAPPNGESFSQLHARVTDFLSEINSHSNGKSIAVITHGGVIRAMLAEVLNLPLKGLFRFQIDHASVTLLNFEQEVPRIAYVNR
jgi:alpha-ribazole phosphatase